MPNKKKNTNKSSKKPAQKTEEKNQNQESTEVKPAKTSRQNIPSTW